MNTIKLKFKVKITIIFITGVLIGGGIVFSINQQRVVSISKEEAGKRVISIINEHILPPETTASLVSVISERGLYKTIIKIQEDEIILYLTKDGALLFPKESDLIALALVNQAEQPIEEQPEFTQEQLGALAKCLTEKRVIFYMAEWCPWCMKQKEMFGKAVEYLPMIDCFNPEGRPGNLDRCPHITRVPNWRFPDQRQREGMMSVQSLIEYSGCVI